MTAGLDPEYERRALFWMRAFPQRYRDAHEVEMLSTLADVEGGRTRPRMGTAIDLVRAGWSERWRTKPPFRQYLWYRLGGRLPEQYHRWMLDDVQGRYYIRRQLAWCAALFGFATLVMYRITGMWAGTGGFLGGFTAAVLSRKRWRDRALSRHGFDPRGVAMPFMPPPPPSPPGFPVKAAARAAWLYVPVGWAWCGAFALALFGMTQQGVAAAGLALALSTVALVVARSRFSAWKRSMRERTLHEHYAILPNPSGLPVAAVVVAVIGLAGLVAAPIIGTAVMVAGAFFGPAAIALGHHARDLETELGRAVPSRFARTHFAPAPPAPPDSHELA